MYRHYIKLLFILGFVANPSQGFTEDTLVSKLSQQLCDKSIVLLGELPSHGEALAFQTKAKISQQLISQCGFDALFFEAPVYEFYGLRNNDKPQPEDLDHAIGGFWMTQELVSWRQWLFERMQNNGLYLAGIDSNVSRTSFYAKRHLPDLVAKQLPSEKNKSCHHAIDQYLHWRYDQQNPFTEDINQQLIACLSSAKNQQPKTAANYLIEQLLMENFKVNLLPIKAQSFPNNRTGMMFKNFQWQKSELPKDAKIIVWTASVHAAKQQGTIKQAPLGSLLTEQYGTQVTAIGFSAYSGESSMAGMPVKPIEAAPEDSLEAQVLNSKNDWVFFDNKQLSDYGQIQSRLFGQFRTEQWDQYFDGVVVFKKEKAPTFQ